MYADDHRPPHFHIVSTTFEVLIALDGLEVIAGRAKPAQIAEALEWAQRNGDKTRSRMGAAQRTGLKCRGRFCRASWP
ncbi:DUF4160 domain-containing protein [Methylosinus sp. Ce-a6]|uniref:DUF4160 domain-containing protein n=1 Tax=Methylosinus sp. Ce-a6 TaxID=2172005 RepID=UPI0034D61DCD